MAEHARDRKPGPDATQAKAAPLTLPEIARSTLFDYEVRGNQTRYRVFYEFVRAYPKIFDQTWHTTPEIEDCLARLTPVDCSADDPDYEAYVEGIRYNLTDAFYTANKPLMDLLIPILYC
jgi:hypothetical protein